MTLATIGTRERLVRAAQKELIQGQGHLEMQAVAKRAQVSVGLAYYHFGSKAGLIAAVVEEFFSQLDAAAFGGAKLPPKSWALREKERIWAYVSFHYAHPFAPLVVGSLSRAPEVLDVEVAFTNQQLAGGALMLRAAQRDGIVPRDLDPDLTIALMVGGIRQALIGALMREHRPDPRKLTNDIWTFVAAALRLTARSEIVIREKAKVARRSTATRPSSKA
jgi:AcrR family transcriptional regulator